MALPKVAKPLTAYNPNKAGTLANKFAVGARTYNGTGSSPHSGGLNPAGFNLREAKAKARRNMLLKQLQMRKGKL